MPAIDLFHRRTLLGGDDLQPTAALSMVGRVVQIVLLCGPVIRSMVHQDAGSCAGGGGGGAELFSSWEEWVGSGSSAQSVAAADDSSCLPYCHFYSLLLTVWIASTVLYSTAALILDRRIVHWSSVGSPTETEPRASKVSFLVELKLAVFSVVLFLVWCTGISAVSFALFYSRCTSGSQNEQEERTTTVEEGTAGAGWLIPFLYQRRNWWWVAAGALLVSQIVEVLMSWVFLRQVFLLPAQIDTMSELGEQLPDNMARTNEDEPLHSYNHELVEEMWAERCVASCHFLSTTTCYMFGGHSVTSTGPAEFLDVARALADFLESRGVLNVVPSDIVTGLVVLQRLQRQRVYAARLQFRNDMLTIAAAESGAVEDSDDENAASAAAVTAQSKKHLVAKSNIRKRVASTNSLKAMGNNTTMSSSARTPSSENLLMPLEGAVDPGVAAASHRRIHHPEEQRALYRFDDAGRFHQEQRALLNTSDVLEMSILEEAARYAKYALAIYTWVLYLYERPITGPSRLMAKSSCRSCCHSFRREGQHEPLASPVSSSPLFASTTSDQSHTLHYAADDNGRIEGDNLCETHKSAILLTAGLSEADLVYVQLKSSFSDVPYCILLDHEWRSVVVSIRGTFSLEDCVTDVLIEPESLEELGNDFGFDGSNQYCHGGVLSCVRNVYRDLERHGLLDHLLLGENAIYPEYTLRLCGHSLGAATCTLISFMLRPKFPSLRCLNYSPPGVTFTWEMATQCKEWCTSCVLDSDLVPRLSVDAMERLRDEVLELIGRIKVPKIEVARRFVHSSLWVWGIRLSSEHELEDAEALMKSIEDILHDPDEVPDSEFQQQLARFKAIQEERRRQRGTTRAIQLYPPGRILHLAKTGEARSIAAGLAKCLTCCTTNMGSRYVPVWINNDDLNEIVVSPTMATDHFPNRMRAILEETAENFGLG